MESELLPCPFCGGVAKEISENHMFAIQCMTCECKTDYFYSYKKPSDIWNTRTNKDAQDSENIIEIELTSSQVLADLKEWLSNEINQEIAYYQRLNINIENSLRYFSLKNFEDKIKELQGE